MKLVRSKIAHSDTISTDDGVVIGVIYYGTKPVNDEGDKPSDLFRKWWKETIEKEDNHLTAEPK